MGRQIYPFAHAWKAAVSPKANILSEESYIAKTRAFFEIKTKTRSRTKGQRQPHMSLFQQRLIHELPVQISHKAGLLKLKLKLTKAFAYR
jgi:hypothetical protein